jgi:hypothetical protein
MRIRFGRPCGRTVDSNRSQRSARSRHAWEHQSGREFDSMFEAAVVEAAIITRHDFTTGTFVRPRNCECRVEPPFSAARSRQGVAENSC